MTLSDYISLFPGASREKNKLMALAEAILQQVIDMQNVIIAINESYSYLEAEGRQLDAIAADIGLERKDTTNGVNCSDADFRNYILAKLALWGWNGMNDTVPNILAAGLPGNTEKDNVNGTVTVSPATGLPAPVINLAPIPAGIGNA